MTPDEVLSQLRDIHTPQVASAVDWTVLDPRPLIVFAVLAALIAGVPAWRRWRKRQALRRRVTALATIPPPEQRDALAQIATRLPPTKDPAPQAFFESPDKIGQPEAEVLRRWMLERVR